jgi:hypothetical protein
MLMTDLHVRHASRHAESAPVDAPNTFVIIVGHEVHFPLPHETHATKNQTNLLERNETGRVGGTDTRPSVLDGLAVQLLAIFAVIFF